MLRSSTQTWINIWRNVTFQDLPLWDDQSELVYKLLSSFLPLHLNGNLILEAGSGTGRISLRLAKEGAEVVLMDVSREAAIFTKKLFADNKVSGYVVVADLFNLPFKKNSFNFVWNSGVLEHFSIGDINQIVDDILKILIRNGMLVVLVPNKRALFYNFFRILAMKLGKWCWGYEEPLSSQDFRNLSHKPVFLSSAGFLCQFKFFCLPPFEHIWNEILNKVYGRLRVLDHRVPGYLIAAGWKNNCFSNEN